MSISIRGARTPTVLPPLPEQQSVPTRPGPAQSVDADQHALVIGYLSAVAYRLSQRGFVVQEVHAQQETSPRLWGELTLGPDDAASSAWAPVLLSWGQDSGWSATLLPGDHRGDHSGDQRLAVRRYLPTQLVAAPVTVAHFLAALRADANTIWACTSPRPPHRPDRRLLVLQLARFALPEPW